MLDSLIDRGLGARANLLVTQPRRISAMGVAERIAAERAEPTGHTAGYAIRLESKRSRHTRLLLCTTGVLLRRLQVWTGPRAGLGLFLHRLASGQRHDDSGQPV